MLPLRRPRALALAASLVAIAPSVARADTVAACIRSANDGQAAKRKGSLLRAREDFVACARDGCPSVIRTDCARWLDEVEARIPAASVRIQTDDGRDVSARLFVDGKEVGDFTPGRAMRMEPGEHVFRAEAPELPAGEETVLLAEGEKARVVTIVLARPKVAAPPGATGPAPRDDDRPAPSPPVLVYPLAGIGVVGLAGFTIWGLSGRSAADDLRDGCGRTSSCAEADVDAARSKYLVADISLAIGIVALGAATVLWLTSR